MKLLCKICGVGVVTRLNHKNYPDIYVCHGCRGKFVWPQLTLTELRELYNQEYFCNPESASAGYDNYRKDRGIILKTFRRRLGLIEGLKPDKGRLLDLGCGMGFFLDVASNRGWDVWGVDISGYAASVARDDLKARIFVGTIEQASFPDSHFDVVTAWDYLEHVTDPNNVLAICRKMLKPDGLLVLTTPDVGSWVAGIAGQKWMGYKRDHLFYFSRRSLAVLLSRNDFLTVRSFFAGKYIMARWFIERLGIYFPRLSKFLGMAHSRLRLPDFHFYINPGDITMVIARKIVPDRSRKI